MKIRFYDSADDSLLKFAVIVAMHGGKWVFCRHRDRNSYELPGGHRENGEDILTAAARELREETGAASFRLEPVCVYSATGRNRVNPGGEECFGMLYHAEIETFSGMPECEIASIELMDALPENWTYPDIQPFLIQEYLRRCK